MLCKMCQNTPPTNKYMYFKSKIYVFFAGFVMILGLPSCGFFQTTPVAFYVSPQGNDQHSGTKDKPFLSINRAMLAVRELNEDDGLPENGITVYLREGKYTIDTTLIFSEKDGGTAMKPVVWKAFANEQVVFSGGKAVSGFKHVQDTSILWHLSDAARENVVKANLFKQGIHEFGTLQKSGFGKPVTPVGAEVFYEGQPMTLARYPNQGWVTIKDVPQDGTLKNKGDEANPGANFNDIPAGRHFGRFTYDDERPEKWAEYEEIWMHGYWVWDWADMYEKVDALDKEKNEIYLLQPYHHYRYRKGQRYYYLNVLSELDSVGEWYLDRKSGDLFLWPEIFTDSTTVTVSLLDSPVISLKNTEFLTFEGITFEECRGTAVRVSGGSNNKFLRCTFRNIGNYALIIEGGTDNGVQSCEIYNTGDGGIILQGGNRATLKAGRNYVMNTHIHHYSRWHRTNRPAILIEGVGNTLSHNHIHDAPHMGIRFHGNKHIIEFNEIHDIAKETGDVGAVYVGRDWTYWGNIIRFNYFHDLHGPGLHGVMAVYLDDWASGTTIYGNVFYKAGRSAFIGGGRNNTIENNIFVMGEPSIHIDARGTSWGKYYFDTTSVHFRSTLYDRMDAVHYDQPPFAEAFPELLTIQSDEPDMPKYNKIIRNISFNSRWLNMYDGLTFTDFTMENNYIADTALVRLKKEGDEDFTTLRMDDEKTVQQLQEKGNIVVESNPGFVDWKNQDFRLVDEAPAWVIEFQPIPFHHIGLIED